MGQNKHSFLTVSALGVVQFDPGCVDVKAKLTVLTGVVYKKINSFLLKSFCSASVFPGWAPRALTSTREKHSVCSGVALRIKQRGC